jgi:peroxiredoxin
MNKSISLFISVIISLSALSQNVVITGKAANQVNKLVRVIVYSDQFSMFEHTIAQTRTNNMGEFTMKLDVEKTQFAYLAFELDKGEFYLSPGGKYNFTINNDTTIVSGSIFDRLPLNFTLNADDGGIVQTIGDFNMDYNDFVYNNITSIYKSRDKSTVMKFITDMKEKYTKNNLEYVNNYVEYSLVSLLWLSRKENNNQILENYIINKPVLYYNIQYTAFFKDFFKNYFASEKLYTNSELVYAINNPDNKVLSYLLLRYEQTTDDERVSEIVKMLLLSRNYYNRDVIKEEVITKLNNIVSNSSYSKNRLIAANFISVLKEMQSGSHAPKFTLVDSNMDTISLDNFNGKFVLLSFVKDNCKICNFHMQLLSDIKKQNQGAFEIVTIVAGSNLKDVINLKKENGFDWPILKLDENILLLEDYNIVAYPSYIFVNPDGTIAYAHLPMPDENMELYLQRFMDQYNKQ